MDARVEQVLIGLAQQFVPQVLQSWDRSGKPEQRTSRLARALAQHNILVIMADQPPSLQAITRDARSLVAEWVNNYLQLYMRICHDLFPSLTQQVTAHYADDRWPVIIYIQGAASNVIQVMAGYIAPYIAQAQFKNQLSEVEINGLLDWILDELEASTLPLNITRKLRSDGTVILKQILTSPIQAISLTDFDRPIFTESQRIVPIQPPTTLPEVGSLEWHLQNPPKPQAPVPSEPLPPMPASDMTPGSRSEPPDQARPNANGSALPLLPPRREGERRRRPPVPPLPGESDT
jgi:hypothetical protein